MGIVAWIVLGAIAGFIANLLMGSRDGLVRMTLLGIGGALIGGFVAGTVLGIGDVTGINLVSIVVAVIGAVGLAAAGQALNRSGRTANRPI